MAQLKFYRKNVAPTKDLAAGAIWFNTSDKTIQIYTGTEWEKYAGNLKDATWSTDKKTLTITKHDGSSIALDFSDMASATVMGNMITAIGLNTTDGTFKKNATNYGGSATSIGGEVSAIDSALKGVSDNLGTKNDAANKDGSAFARIANLASLVSDLTGGSTDSIEGQITAAINALRTEIVGSLGTDDAKTIEKINDELDSIISDASDVEARVKAIEDDYLTSADETSIINTLKGGQTDNASSPTIAGAKLYTDALAKGAVKSNTDAIAVLNGNDTQAGSVAKQIKDAINAFAGSADSDNVIENVTELLNYVSGVDGSKDLASAIAQIEENKGKIETLNGGNTTAGSVAKAVKDAIDAEVERADEAYATAVQGGKADTAVQKADVTTGATNGTIKVQGQEVSVAGLKSAAFTESTAYATAAQGTKADSALQEITSANTAAIEITNKSVVTPKIIANGALISMNYFGQPTGNSPLVDAAGAQNLVKTYVDNALAWAEF